MNHHVHFTWLDWIQMANRDMDFLNIGLFGLGLKSNVQVGNEFLMDEFIGKASSMKSVIESVQEYETYLPLDIAVLERRLRRHVDVSASTSTYEPAVITKDRDSEEEIQEARDYFEIQEDMEVGHQTNISGSTSPTISERVRKLFPGIGWFAGNIYGIKQKNDDNIYEILFEDGNTEE